MTRPVVDLDRLVPDLVFQYGGERYTISGDPPVEVLLELQDLAVELDGGQADEERTGEIARRFVEIVGDLFRDRDPSLERLPFGVVQCQRIVEELVANATPAASRATRRAAKPATARKPGTRRR